jgi:hypothetical protein
MLSKQHMFLVSANNTHITPYRAFAKHHPSLFRVADTQGFTLLHHLGNVVLDRAQAAAAVSMVLRYDCRLSCAFGLLITAH